MLDWVLHYVQLHPYSMEILDQHLLLLHHRFDILLLQQMLMLIMLIIRHIQEKYQENVNENHWIILTLKVYRLIMNLSDNHKSIYQTLKKSISILLSLCKDWENEMRIISFEKEKLNELMNSNENKMNVNMYKLSIDDMIIYRCWHYFVDFVIINVYSFFVCFFFFFFLFFVH